MSIIDATSCNGARESGCKHRPPTVAVRGAPSWAVVDTARHTVYVPDQVENNISVLGDQSCHAHAFSGCRHPAATAAAGDSPNAAATDERFHTVYAGDAHGFQPPFKVSMIDAATCNVTDRSGCTQRPRAVRTDGPHSSISVNQRTNTVYGASGGPLEVIAAATRNARTSAGCEHTAAVPAGGYLAAVDPTTNTIYAASTHNDHSGYLSVIDGRHCNTADTSGCAGQTTATTATITVGHDPAGVAVESATQTVYVTNSTDHTVSVIDTSHCHAGDTSRCSNQTPPTILMPPGPSSVPIDPHTQAVYLGNQYDSSVTVINGRHCSATDASRCSPIRTVQVGSYRAMLRSTSTAIPSTSPTSMTTARPCSACLGPTRGKQQPPHRTRPRRETDFDYSSRHSPSDEPAREERSTRSSARRPARSGSPATSCEPRSRL